MRTNLAILVVLSLGGCSGCSSSGRDAGTEERWTGHVIWMKSPAFEADKPIPKVHAYKDEGNNVSPLLTWSNPPPGVEEFAVICEDPDAPGGTWVHWVVYNIPKEATGLPEGMPPGKGDLDRPAGAKQGENSFGEIGYGGPIPPKGSGAHRYRFIVYALGLKLPLKAGATAAELREAMHGHVIGRGEIVGTYQR